MAFRNVPLNKNLLFIGPQETGKSSILTSLPNYHITLYMDLDDPQLVRDLLKNPELFDAVLTEVGSGEWLTINRIDRIVKYIPKLIGAIRNKNIFIAATSGSLSCFNHDPEILKLFHIEYFGSMNFSQVEKAMNLNEILSYGTLPKIYNLEKVTDKVNYLKNYVQEFLDLEIIFKSRIRNLVPFHLFLPLMTQNIGRKMNCSALAQELDTDSKTIKNYFELLVKNHVGFYLESYSQPLRSEQIQAPKFYLFDPGFHRALSNTVDQPLLENSYEYSQLFKAWCISEIRKNQKLKLSQIETKHGINIDLIIENGSGEIDLVIFTTASKILPKHLKSLINIGSSIPKARLYCVTSEIVNETRDNVNIVNYKDFLIKNFVLL